MIDDRGITTKSRYIIAAFAALLVVTSVPIVTTQYLPLWDYPSHIGRIFIWLNLPDIPALSKFYEYNPGIVADLIFDVIATPLAAIWSPDIAGRITLILSFALIATGVLALNYTIYRRLSVTTLLVFVLLFNGALLMGFIAFLLGLGMWLWAVAAWLRWRSLAPWRRLAVGMAISILLLYAHMFAFALYGLTVGTYELVNFFKSGQSGRAGRRLLLALSQFLPSIVLFFLSSSAAVGEDSFRWASLYRKIIGLSWAVAFYEPIAQVLAFLVGVAVVLWLIERKVLSIQTEFQWVLLAFCLVLIALPYQAFGSYFVCHRMIVPLLFLAVAILNDRQAEGSGKQFAVGATLVLFAVLETTFITLKWQGFDRDYADVNRLLDRVEPGAMVHESQWIPGRDHTKLEPPFFHVVSFRIPDRYLFTQGYLASPHHQTIILHEPYAKIVAQTRSIYYDADHWPRDDQGRLIRKNPLEAPIMKEYDYLLLIDWCNECVDAGKYFAPLASTGRFELWRRRR